MDFSVLSCFVSTVKNSSGIKNDSEGALALRFGSAASTKHDPNDFPKDCSPG